MKKISPRMQTRDCTLGSCAVNSTYQGDDMNNVVKLSVALFGRLRKLRPHISRFNFVGLIMLFLCISQPAFSNEDSFIKYSNDDFSLKLPKSFQAEKMKTYQPEIISRQPAHIYTFKSGALPNAKLIIIKKFPINNTSLSIKYIKQILWVGYENIKLRGCSKIILDSGITHIKIGKYAANYFSVSCEKYGYQMKQNVYGISENNNAYFIESGAISKGSDFDSKSYAEMNEGISTISLKK